MSKAFVVANLGCLGCVLFAGVLALKGLDGWGWFLLVAVLIHSAPGGDS